MKEKVKWTPHFIAVSAFVVFIVLGLACASLSGDYTGGIVSGLTDTNAPVEEQSILVIVASNFGITRINDINVRQIHLSGVHVGSSFSNGRYAVLPPGEYTFRLRYYEQLQQPRVIAGMSYNYLEWNGTITAPLKPGQVYAFNGIAEPADSEEYLFTIGSPLSEPVPGGSFLMRFSIQDLSEIENITIWPNIWGRYGANWTPDIIPSEKIVSDIHKDLSRNKLKKLFVLNS